MSASFSLLADTDMGSRVLLQLEPTVSTADKRIASMDRARALGAGLNMALEVGNGPAPDMMVVSAEGMSAEALAEQLQAQPGVVFATPDRRKQTRAVPNDPLFDTQWALRSTEAAAIAAVDAWTSTTGSGEVVVAILDTGVRFEHEDLAERLLPGYDFISDPRAAGDGSGRDADASDEGDFLSALDLQDPYFSGCGDGPAGNLPTTSSWHGTRVAGIVAATGNNSRGIAGVSWSARLLPARALGKCGGFDSDILAAMRWAGGLAVPGVPQNPHPARIINMSLGGPGQCSAAYASTVAELRAASVLVIAAAGNGVELVEEPGNCPGVFTVGGLRHNGTKVGFSSFGPEVDVSAPAGNCVNIGVGEPCVFQISTTTNQGSTTPAADGYSTGLNPTVGTSFAAPLASGAAALMLSLHPQLQPEALSARMQVSARAFPVDPGLPFCPEFAMGSGQCNCTTGFCGAGMLDAGGAVALARAPQVLAEAVRDPSGQWLLDAGGSSASVGRQVVAWQWAHVDGPTIAQFLQPAGVTTRMLATLPGLYTVSLTVTDDLGQQNTGLLRIETTEFQPPPEPQPPAEPVQPSPDDGVKEPRSGGGGGATTGFSLIALLLLALVSFYVRGGSALRRSSANTVPPR